MTSRFVSAVSLAIAATLMGSGAASAKAESVKATPACEEVPHTAANTLSAAERSQGWLLLWDGKNTDQWRGIKSDVFPTGGWTTCGGTLTIHEKGGEESGGGGDIVTRARYSDFELQVDFRITPGANSGIKIFAQSDLSPIDKNTGQPVKVGSGIGMEFQVLDDDRHPDARLGRNGNRKAGSLYDLIAAPADKKINPPGEWNTARILSKGDEVTFWLNGKKTVLFKRGSAEFREAVNESKFKTIPGFGEWQDGHILLQDHGNTVSFRNIKLRDLSRR